MACRWASKTANDSTHAKIRTSSGGITLAQHLDSMAPRRGFTGFLFLVAVAFACLSWAAELRCNASSNTAGYVVSIGTTTGNYSQEINVGNVTAYPLIG